MPHGIYERPLAPRFWKKVRKVEGEGCWQWQGTRSSRGYGEFNVNYKRRYAHRVAYQITYGPIPEGLFVCHKCDNPLCVRPDHLFLGTVQDNVADMVAKGRASGGPNAPRHKKRSPARNEPPPRKLSDAQYAEIYALVQIDENGRAHGVKMIADLYGVSETLVSRIAHGRISRAA